MEFQGFRSVHLTASRQVDARSMPRHSLGDLACACGARPFQSISRFHSRRHSRRRQIPEDTRIRTNPGCSCIVHCSGMGLRTTEQLAFLQNRVVGVSISAQSCSCFEPFDIIVTHLTFLSRTHPALVDVHALLNGACCRIDNHFLKSYLKKAHNS